MTLDDKTYDDLIDNPFADTNPLADIGHAVIISAHLSSLTKEQNAKRSADLLEELLDLVGFDAKVYPVDGKYNGVEEQSFLVTLPPASESVSPLYIKLQDGIIKLAQNYGQECMILINTDEDGDLYAMFVDDRYDLTRHPLLVLKKECSVALTSVDYVVFKDVCYTTPGEIREALDDAIISHVLNTSIPLGETIQDVLDALNLNTSCGNCADCNGDCGTDTCDCD